MPRRMKLDLKNFYGHKNKDYSEDMPNGQQGTSHQKKPKVLTPFPPPTLPAPCLRAWKDIASGK